MFPRQRKRRPKTGGQLNAKGFRFQAVKYKIFSIVSRRIENVVAVEMFRNVGFHKDQRFNAPTVAW
jgi:hypothetical protein